MVKGVSRQVIVVRPKDEKLFDQAIFLLREDAAKTGVTDEQLLTQARKAASRCLHQDRRRKTLLHRLLPAVYMTIGAVLASLGWLITTIF